jgi:hypothetical protein
MKEILYRGYKIAAIVQKEGTIWLSCASVSVPRGRQMIQMQDQETLFDNQSDAEEHALRLGQHWVNNQLQIQRGDFPSQVRE